MKMIAERERNYPPFGEILRDWRRRRKKSQLDLSLDIGISTKHLSFVETGRSKPSRELVLKISSILKLPLRHHNALLTSAGYVAEYSEESFESPRLEIIKHALDRMLEKHEPYPAFVVNASYDILKVNEGYRKLLGMFLERKFIEEHNNILKLTFDPLGLCNFIDDWASTSQFLLMRIWEEAVASNNERLLNLYDQLRMICPFNGNDLEMPESSLPVLALRLKKDSLSLNFFTTVTTLGTALDLTAQELRIESLFPIDGETKSLFE